MDSNKKIKLIIALILLTGIVLLGLSIYNNRSLPMEDDLLEQVFETSYTYVHSDECKYLYSTEEEWINAEVSTIAALYPNSDKNKYYLPENYQDSYISWRAKNKQNTVGSFTQVSIKELNEKLNSERKEAIENDNPFTDFKQYCVTDYSARGLLTQAEIKKLNDSTNAGKFRVTKEEAKEDVELYFRALRYAYGAYYYWGGQEVFDKAEKQVYDALESKTQITKYDLGNIMNNALSFVVDSHFTINGVNQATSNSVKHVYYYNTTEKYTKDEIGYYKLYDGQKWYYNGNSNPDQVSICVSVDDEGKLYYGLKQFCAKDKVVETTTIYYTNGTTTKESVIAWDRCKTYAKQSMHEPKLEFFKENDIVYIAVRNFEEEHDKELQEFVKTGIDASKAKAVILDVRSNGGGLSTYCSNWYRNFAGRDVDMKMVRAARYNALSNKNHTSIGTETANFIKSDGKFIDCKVPVFVLVDENSGSSGEIIANQMKTLSNSLIIGSNTYGCDFCADLQYYYLPNSGMIVSFGTSLAFYNTMENTDGIGYLPDVWVNPQDALEYTINMIANSDIASTKDSLALKTDLELEAVLPDDIMKNIVVSLNFENVQRAYSKDLIKFQAQNEITFWAEVNEKKYYDTTVTASSPNVRIYPNANGSVSIISAVPGSYTITVVVGGHTEIFKLEVMQ